MEERPLDYLFSDILKTKLRHPLHKFVKDVVYEASEKEATSCIESFLPNDGKIGFYVLTWTKSFLVSPNIIDLAFRRVPKCVME